MVTDKDGSRSFRCVPRVDGIIAAIVIHLGGLRIGLGVSPEERFHSQETFRSDEMGGRILGFFYLIGIPAAKVEQIKP